MLGASTSPQERRRHPRTQLKMTLRGIRLDPDGGDVLNTFRMVDISQSGMGVLSEKSFYPGQRIVLDLPIGMSAGRRNVSARVVHCLPEKEGYHIGLEFETTATNSWVGVSGQAIAA